MINLSDIIEGVPEEKSITTSTEQFNDFTNDMIDSLLKSFESTFNIECSEDRTAD